MSSLEPMALQILENYGAEISEKPKLPNEEQATVINNELLQEIMLLNDAFDVEDLVVISGTLASMVYDIAIFSKGLGIPLDSLVQECHRAGMEDEPAQVSDVLMKHLYTEDPKDFREHIQ